MKYKINKVVFGVLIALLLGGSILTFKTIEESTPAFPLAFSFSDQKVVKESQEDFSKLQLIPSGQPFGIKLFMKGVLVIGMTKVDSANGAVNPSALINVGDSILSINGIKIDSNEEIADIIEKTNGKCVKIILIRKGKTLTYTINPVKSKSENKYKIGIWVRDSAAGIGTITYINPKTKTFGALGHGLYDIDTGNLLIPSKGEIYGAMINEIIKGNKYNPGELRGFLMEESTIGRLSYNTEEGVFGYLSNFKTIGKLMSIGLKGTVKKSSAQILCTIDKTEPLYYNIKIISLNMNNSSKNMIIEITDKRLLDKTGGIAQGMSGSPIIQNGKLIGAVTHVFLNNSKQGFGIFIENMIINSEGR